MSKTVPKICVFSSEKSIRRDMHVRNFNWYLVNGSRRIQYLVKNYNILGVSCKKCGLFKKLVKVLKNNNGNILFIIKIELITYHSYCSRLFREIERNTRNVLGYFMIKYVYLSFTNKKMNLQCFKRLFCRRNQRTNSTNKVEY